jgi:hypothetical protein
VLATRFFDLVGQMVAGHEADHLRAQYAMSVQNAAIHQHLAKPKVIRDGADRASAAALEFDLLGDLTSARYRRADKSAMPAT